MEMASPISEAWIHQVLEQVHLDTTITEPATAGTIELLEALRVHLAPLAAATDPDDPDHAAVIRTTLASVLPADLVKYAISEATQAQRRHAKHGNSGLVFALKDGIAVSATLEYLCSELLELGGNAAHDNDATQITSRHLLIAIIFDEALSALFAPSMDTAVPPVPDTSDAVLPGLARALAERIFARRFGAALEAHNAAVSAAQRVTCATSLTQGIAKNVVLRAMGPDGTSVDRLRRFITQAPALPTPDGVSSWSSVHARVILRAIQRVARAHPAECGLA